LKTNFLKDSFVSVTTAFPESETDPEDAGFSDLQLKTSNKKNRTGRIVLIFIYFKCLFLF
jgi:hypothetical protein